MWRVLSGACTSTHIDAPMPVCLHIAYASDDVRLSSAALRIHAMLAPLTQPTAKKCQVHAHLMHLLCVVLIDIAFAQACWGRWWLVTCNAK